MTLLGSCRRRRRPALRSLDHNLTAPALAYAFELALKSMRALRANRYSEIDPAELRATVALNHLFQHKELSEPLSLKPLVTAAVCSKCGEHMWLGTKSAPAKCRMTLGCTGSLFRARST